MIRLNLIRALAPCRGAVLAIVASMAICASDAGARQITVYAATLSTTGDWQNVERAAGSPEANCSVSANYATNSIPGSLNWLTVADWASFTILPYEYVESVVVDVNGRYDNPSHGNTFNLRAIVNGETYTLESLAWTQADESCDWRMGDGEWDITYEFMGVDEWTEQDLKDLTVRVQRQPGVDGQGGSVARVNAFRMTITTVELDPEAQLSAETVDFGTLVTGMTATRSMSITNIGGGQLTGDAALDKTALEQGAFIVSGGGSYSLSNGQTRAVTVGWTPRAADEAFGSLEWGDDDWNWTDFTGTAIAPPCDVQPTELEISDTGPANQDRVVTVRHAGAVGVLYGTAELTPEAALDGFSIISGGGEFALAAGQVRSITLRFDPSFAGYYATILDLDAALVFNECSWVTYGGGSYSSAPSETEVVVGIRAMSASANTGTLELRFGVPADAQVSVDVFDLAGRHVCNVASSHFVAGNHAIAWNMRDSRGNRVPSGAYFARLRAGGETRAARFMIVR